MMVRYGFYVNERLLERIGIERPDIPDLSLYLSMAVERMLNQLVEGKDPITTLGLSYEIKGVRVKCPACGHQWIYKGRAMIATCKCGKHFRAYPSRE